MAVDPARTDRFRALSTLLAVMGLVGLIAALTPVAPASAKSFEEYPKAGVILQTKVAAHSRPSSSSPTIRFIPQFRSDFRPTTLLVLGEAKGAKGSRWLKLSMPVRPNGTIGWVKASAVQMRPVQRSIVIDLSSRKLRVLEQGKTRFATRVAVGRKGMETPTGTFYITAKFKPTERFLGAFAFETSAYSKLSEWPGGGVVGLHGTLDALATRAGSVPWLRSHVERGGTRAQAARPRRHPDKDRRLAV